MNSASFTGYKYAVFGSWDYLSNLGQLDRFMDYDVYKVEENPDRTYFVFKSVGPKGTIAKFVQFEEDHELIDHYNLVLGDIENGQPIVDKVTDNGDIVKVMATVARIIKRFLYTYPTLFVKFHGLDSRRNHLYTRIIYQHLHEFIPQYKIMARVGKKYYQLTSEMAGLRVLPEYDLFIIRKEVINQ